MLIKTRIYTKYFPVFHRGHQCIGICLPIYKLLHLTLAYVNFIAISKFSIIVLQNQNHQCHPHLAVKICLSFANFNYVFLIENAFTTLKLYSKFVSFNFYLKMRRQLIE